MLILAKTSFLPSLKRLQVDNNYLTHAGLTLMPEINVNRLKDLVFLSLSTLSFYADDNNIGVKGVQLLIKTDFLVLEELSLRGTKIGIEGTKALSKAYWPSLKQLWICTILSIQTGIRWLGRMTVSLLEAIGDSCSVSSWTWMKTLPSPLQTCPWYAHPGLRLPPSNTESQIAQSDTRCKMQWEEVRPNGNDFAHQTFVSHLLLIWSFHFSFPIQNHITRKKPEKDGPFLKIFRFLLKYMIVFYIFCNFTDW